MSSPEEVVAEQSDAVEYDYTYGNTADAFEEGGESGEAESEN